MEKEKNKKGSVDKKETDIEVLKEGLEECQKRKEEYLAGWQRERADFLNYKKEEMERIGELMKYANEELILKILPVLDNFELAEKNLKENRDDNEYIKGLLQIKRQLLDFLKCQGVEEINSVGEKFDPNFHEVVEEVPSDSPALASAKAGDLAKEGVESEAVKSGTIIEEVQKGYKTNNGLLRPAKVKVAK